MKSWIVLSVSSLLLVCGAASFYYVFDDFVHAAGDNRSAVTIDANHPDASNNGAEIFAAGTLSGQGQKIADPVFPFELEALAISRSVEVYYERRQTRYHRVRGGSRLVRNSVLRDQGKIYIQQGKIAQFGSDSADDNAEPPEFVARTLDLLPDTIVYAAQIKLGNFIIEPEAIEPGAMGARSYPAFTHAELQSFLDSRQGSSLKELMQEIGLKGVVVDPEQSSALILYRQSAAARSDGDVRVSFEALIPQPVGVMAVQKGVTELTRVIHPEMSEVGNGMPGRLDIQYGHYSDFDAYRKDALYSPVNYDDLFLFGGAGGALLLLGMFGVFAGWQRLSHAG